MRISGKKPHLATGVKEINNYIDFETGELKDSNIKRHKYVVNSKAEFMLLYVNVLPIFMKLSNPAKSTYAYLLCNYDSEIIFEIGGGTRSLIAKTIGISNSAVANGLTELKESSLLYSHSKGMYQINPIYAFKGSTSQRNRVLKAFLELEYKED